MSKFVLTAQLQLQAPKNTSQVLNQTRQQLSSGVTIPVNVKNAKQAQQQITNVAKATQQASSAAQSMGKSFGLATKRFAAFTVASRAISLVTNGLANAVDEAIQFQREMVKISQVTGQSIKQLRGLQKTITSLSTGLGVVSKDLLSTTRILAQAGIQAGDLKVALDALAKTTLAPTFEDIEKTAEGAVAILSQFGEGVGALERQLGAINAVAGQFAVESGDLIGAVRRFGGVFKSAGGELEELLALFTSVRATTRESAESISTGLRTIFTRIQRPKTIEFLRQFGVELLDVEGKFVGPFEAAKRLSDALAGLGEGDITFIRIAEELGGFRQIGKVIPLLQQFEVAERARQAAVEGGNSLTKDAETAQQSLAVQITKVKEEFFALIRAITETASFQVFAKTSLQIASNLIAVADAVKPLIPLLTTLAAIKFARGFGGFLSGVGASFKGKNQGGVIHQFARGGLVPGQGNRDTVPAMLTPGEFVIRKSSVNKMGASTLAAMNENRFKNGKRIEQQDQPIQATFNPIDNAFGGFFTKVGKDQSKPGEGGPFTLTNKSLIRRLGGKGSSMQATLGNAQYSVFTPAVSDVKGGSFKDIIMERLGGPLATAAQGVVEQMAGEGLFDFDPAIKTDANLLKVAKNQIDSDQAFKNSAAGYLYESIITAFTGAKASGSNTAFDFNDKQISRNRDRFSAMFGAENLINKLKKGDAKSEQGKHFKLGQSGSLPNKVVTDINAGKVRGLQIESSVPDSKFEKTELGKLQRRATGGGIGGTDTVPALLTPGEFVVNKKAAQSIGYANLNSMNRSGVARYAQGGVVKFANGGNVPPLTKKGFESELSVGGLGALQEEIKGASITIGELKGKSQKLYEEEARLTANIDSYDKAIIELQASGKGGAKGNKALNRLVQMKIKAEEESLAVTEQLIETEKQLEDVEALKAKKIAQAKDMKEAARGSLTTGTQSTVTEALKSQGQTQSNIKKAQADAAAAAAAAKQAAAAKLKADQKSILSLEQLAGATFGVTTALSFLRPTVDENSSGLEKALATTIDGLMKFTSIIGVVAGALQAFGVKLSKQNFKDLGSFLTGGKLGGARAAKRVQQRFRVGARKAGGAIQNIPGLGKFGKHITKIAPQLGKFAAGLGPIIAGFAAAVGAVSLLTNIVDRVTGVHKKAEEAIEKGNRAQAGQLAVNSRVQKDFNNLAMAAAGVGAAFGPVGAVIGAAVGGLIKWVGSTELGQKAMKAFRDNVLVMFGGDSTKTIEAQANLQASVNKLKLEEADNTKKAAEAMKEVEAGSRTLADAWASGDLTGNLQNQLAVFTDTVALEASKMADLESRYQGGTGSAILGGAIGFAAGGVAGAAGGAAFGSQIGIGGYLKEVGAAIGLTTSFEEDRKASQEAFKKANKEFTSQFKENGEVFSKVSRSIIAANPGASLEEVKATLLRTNPAIAAAVEGMGSDERRKFLDKTIEGSINAYEKQMKAINAMNFGMQKFADRLAGTTALMSSTSTLGESGGTSFDRSAEVLNVALSGAANTLSDGELEGAVNDMKQALRDAGASSEEIEKTVSRFKGLNEINKRLDESSPAFKKFQQDLRNAQVGGVGDLSPDAVLKQFAESMTEGLDEEAAKQVRDSLEAINLDQTATDQILAGDLTPLYNALGEAGEEFKKQIVDGIVKQRGAAEKELINSIKRRKASEDEFIAAQRKAIDVQLEAAKVFEDFGGRALTGQEKLSARVAQFNVGAGAAGITGLGSGSASDIRRVAGEIGGNFNTLQSQATIGVMSGQQRGAFDNVEGAERDNRERLKKANADLLNFTKQRIGLLKEELAIVQKKNQEEKNALEKLLSGDIEGFLQGQAAAGAGAALRTGDAGLAGLFGASALGAGFKSLEGQGLGDAAMERAAGLSLGAVGVTDTRSAQILAGTTAEEEAIKSQGRELAGVMGDLAQQQAQFEKAEITTQQAIVNANEVRLENLSAAANQAQGFARGGPVYASRGMFVPRGTDTVPAMLTPGEFVVNRSAVQRGNNLQLLRAMNSGGGASGPGNMSGGGQVRYYNLGGIVESIGSAFSDALPNLQNVFSNFAASVDKLVNTKFNVALDTTNVNVNFNGASFLETLKEDIKNELLEEVSEQIKKAKPSTSGDMETRSTVLGN